MDTENIVNITSFESKLDISYCYIILVESIGDNYYAINISIAPNTAFSRLITVNLKPVKFRLPT